MVDLLTSAQMRAIERTSIDSGVVSALQLMERAGQGVVDAIFKKWPELRRHDGTALVLCGPGNNGGDGFVVARLLKGAGWGVKVLLYGHPDQMPPDARNNYDRWLGLGDVSPLHLGDIPHPFPQSDLTIDALFGTGLTRPLEKSLAQVLSSELGAFSVRKRIVAIDAPSGLCMDSGRFLTGADPLTADLTVSFHKMKLGHVLAEGPMACGQIVVVDIGLPQNAGQDRMPNAIQTDVNAGAMLVDAQTLGGVDKLDSYSHSGHKFDHGHALILSGGFGKTGAARLAARGALRVGVGVVTLGVPPSARMEVACQITAIMQSRVSDASELKKILLDKRINAICLGPGLGFDRAEALVPISLGDKIPCVLDADALSAFADDPEALFQMLHPNVVLTPHAGEFARLFPNLSQRLSGPSKTGPAFSKVDAALEAAKRAGCVVLFKGADTVIASSDGRYAVHSAHYERSVPWLATAGAGDVLSGIITGLLARGFSPLKAASAGAFLHVEAARMFGPGLIAEDLAEILPEVFRSLRYQATASSAPSA